MKKWMKQFFCIHIWKDGAQEILKHTKIYLGTYHYKDVYYFVIHQSCIKCGKDKLETKREELYV